MPPGGAMAVSASIGAMNSVLSKLTKLREEGNMAGLSKGMSRQVVFLRDELSSMKGLLEKLADREDHDALVKGWMRQVREMTYDLEDSIDLFVHSAYPLGRENSLQQMLKRLRRSLQHPFASKIEEMKLRVVEASERRSRYKLDDAAIFSLPTVHVDSLQLASLSVSKDTLVGIERPRDELIAILEDWQQREIQVVAIVGFGGIGKTTLAMAVCEVLQLKFDCRAVVNVSQRPDITRLLQDMFRQVGPAHSAIIDTLDLRQLIDFLREFLYHKRYLIVIDDLWSTEAWDILRWAFPENGLDSKVLVTTRIMDIAMSCCKYQTRSIYRMKPLSESESRSLLFRRAFKSELEESYPSELFAISNDILKKCGGLPLAIIAVGSMLATGLDVVQVRKKLTDSMGSESFKYPTLEDMLHILDLSYVSLPIPLKTCLLYLSMFPEDYVIERRRLVRRWMAEGFISRNLEEVGERYFNELINRGLIQPVGIQCDGRVNTFQVHDMVLDLILRRSAEENFVIISGSDGRSFGLQDKVRRLSLDCNSRWDTFKPSETTYSHVRSLTVIGSNRQMPSLSNFRVLRVLDIENYGEVESKYFESIGKLYLLKYVRLQTPSYIQLPEEMGKLENLETLDLAGAPKCKLPKSITQLTKLVYFLVKNVKLPLGSGNMSSLKEVSCVDIDSSNCRSSLKELEYLTRLTALGLNLCITGKDPATKDTLVSFLRNLTRSNIQSLYIECHDCCSLDFLLSFPSEPCYHLREFQIKSNSFFNAVPEWMPSVVSLTLLRINIEMVGEEALRILGGLQSLEALILEIKSTVPKQGLIIRSYGFIRLKNFDLTCWNSLGVLKFEPGAMKNLQKLRVVFSTNGQHAANSFVFSIEHLTLLEHLVVEVKCDDVRAAEVKTAADTIRAMASRHPNRPRLELKTHAEVWAVPGERQIPVHGEDDDQNVDHDSVMMDAEPTPATKS